jgi:hypothetical protein
LRRCSRLGLVEALASSSACVMSDYHHGHEPRAEEIALHQKYLTLEGMIDAARLEGDEREVRRLTPLVKRAKARWITANRRVTRGRSRGPTRRAKYWQELPS